VRRSTCYICLIGSSGNKKDNVTVIYTPWSNLKKDGSMAVGQVSFKDNKKVCRDSNANLEAVF
jgi:hypothetical protein